MSLGSLEVATNGSMYSDEKFKLLREKVVLPAECLIVSHLIDNGIKIQKHTTTKFIRNQDTHAVNFTVGIVRKKIPIPIWNPWSYKIRIDRFTASNSNTSLLTKAVHDTGDS